jgi:hypothetical protein
MQTLGTKELSKDKRGSGDKESGQRQRKWAETKKVGGIKDPEKVDMHRPFMRGFVAIL